MKKKLASFLAFIKRHKFWVGVVVIVVLVSVVTIPKRVVSYYKGPVEKYETAKVEKKDLTQTISASGEVSAENQVTLKFQTSGKLAWIGVKEGDFVEKWQALASLDKRELEKKLEKEMNDFMNERWDFEQDRDDYNVNADNLDWFNLSDEVKRILEKANFDLNNTVLDVEIADLAVKLATLTTPIEGIVTLVETPIAGVNITPATAEITVADPNTMKFTANVDEADVAQIRMGQKVIISLDSHPHEEFIGQIDKVAFSAITTRGGGTGFPVEIFLPDNVGQKFKVGMNGDADITIAAEKNILAIPIEALETENSDSFVQIIEGKEIKFFQFG